MGTVAVKGLAELQTLLDTLPAKIEKNVMRGSLRAGMKTVLPIAQAGIHSVSGKLAASLKITSGSQGGVVTASVYTRDPVAHLVEFGTRPHTITAKNRRGLSIGGLFFASVDHPGASPHPFMRPALDSQAQNAVIAAAEYMKNRLATKQGLDTADIEIGPE